MSSFLTLIINVEGQFERKDYAIEQAKKLGLVPKVVKAITPSDFVEDQFLVVNPAVEACWLSHQKALSEFLDSDSEFVLIFEDDVEIESIRKSIDSLIKMTTFNFDLYQVGFLSEGILNRTEIRIKNIQHSFFKILSKFSSYPILKSFLTNRMRIERSRMLPLGIVPADFQAGTHAYIANRKMAEFLLSVNQPFFLPADALLHIVAEVDYFNCVRNRKSYISQRKIPSQITKKWHSS